MPARNRSARFEAGSGRKSIVRRNRQSQMNLSRPSIALSLLSSLVMIRLGKVYAGLMVDVQASNSKLVERRENMLLHLTGRSSEDVRDALRRADGSVKLAMLLLKGCELDEAERVLDSAGGQLRAAHEAILRKVLTRSELRIFLSPGIASPPSRCRPVGNAYWPEAMLEEA